MILLNNKNTFVNIMATPKAEYLLEFKYICLLMLARNIKEHVICWIILDNGNCRHTPVFPKLFFCFFFGGGCCPLPPSLLHTQELQLVLMSSICSIFHHYSPRSFQWPHGNNTDNFREQLLQNTWNYSNKGQFSLSLFCSCHSGISCQLLPQLSILYSSYSMCVGPCSQPLFYSIK